MSGNNLNINTHQNLPKFITECIAQTNLKENFISSIGLEKTELIWNFFSMVEFSGATVDGITHIRFCNRYARSF